MDIFSEIDANRSDGKQDVNAVYKKLMSIYETDGTAKEDIQLLWRLARACSDVASTLEVNNPRKREILDEGQKYALDAYKINPDDFDVVKWAAVLTGQITDFLGTKEKIEQGNAFKIYLDKALSLNSQDHAILHMRGRFAYNVAGLSWIERKIASALFATPPTATYDEAIVDFLEVEKLRSGWIENKVYLSRSYLARNDKENALQHLKIAKNLVPVDESEKTLLKEVDILLKKHGK